MQIRFSMFLSLTIIISSFQTSAQKSKSMFKKLRIYDAHGHLTLYNGNGIDSLKKYGVYGIRDCGGSLNELLALRKKISESKSKTPKIILCGPFLDGPKKTQREAMTIFITSETEAIKAVDSLYALGVDFIKTHNGLSRENYFAVLSQAKIRKLKVVSHLPKGVAMWEAVEHGVSCIEHIAESVLASPIYAGYVKTPKEAANWWLTSAKADSLIRIMAAKKIFVTPTLVAFQALVNLPENKTVKEELANGLADLMKITFKLHKAGIRILAGSDFSSVNSMSIHPGQSIYEELKLLMAAGLTRREVKKAASFNFENWLSTQSL